MLYKTQIIQLHIVTFFIRKILKRAPSIVFIDVGSILQRVLKTVLIGVKGGFKQRSITVHSLAIDDLSGSGRRTRGRDCLFLLVLYWSATSIKCWGGARQTHTGTRQARSELRSQAAVVLGGDCGGGIVGRREVGGRARGEERELLYH